MRTHCVTATLRAGFLFSFLFLPFAVHSQTGMAFLKVGIGGRAAGLAETGVALANDPAAIYWNPAGLDRNQGTVALLSHNSWLQNIRADFLAISFPAFSGVIGLGLNIQTIPDIELRTIPAPAPIGVFDARDLSLTVAYSRALRNDFQVGVSVKYLHERIHVESASGVALDAGVLVKNLVTNLRLGATMQNFGRVSALRNEEIELPALARIGAAYSPSFSSNETPLNLTFLADAVIFFDGGSGVSVAGEYIFQKTIALRAGYQFDRENRGLAGGLGLTAGRYRIDYGYLPFSSNVGDTHRISFAVKL